MKQNTNFIKIRRQKKAIHIKNKKIIIITIIILNYQKKSWLRMKSLSSKVESMSAVRGEEEGRRGSAEAADSRRFWKEEGFEEENWRFWPS